MKFEIVGINPDLERERAQCSFDIEEFARWWWGGKANLQEKRERERYVLDDPIMQDDTPPSYLSHKEVYEVNVKKAAHVMGKIRELMRAQPISNFNDNYIEVLYSYMSHFTGMFGAGTMTTGSPFGTHFGMFFPTIMEQGTDEQRAKWAQRAWTMDMIGTYAQTELGHGTFIRGLQTTATFDAATQEFVLQSPSISAYKWWPGGLGHTTNYAVVIAQMYSRGKHCGLQSFMVQLRDNETWHPLPGIIIGEIGPKLGLSAVNNGYLGFDNVRIPRDSMLMRNARIDADGTFVEAPANVLTYTTMIFVRSTLAQGMTSFLSSAATIATRYSVVRRQSPIDPKLPEPQVIDHLTQQNKLFPNIARTVVYKLIAKRIWTIYIDITNEIRSGNLLRMPEIHALSCCIKAVTTWDATFGIETLRLACGGHGFMACSNMPALYGHAAAAATYDGEATIMLLQTARYLVKYWRFATENPQTNLPGIVAYLREYANGERTQFTPSLDGIVASLKAVAANKTRIAFEHLEKRLRQGIQREEATNLTSIELAQAADAFGRAYIVETAVQMTQHVGKEFSASLATVIQQLVELYTIEAVNRSMADLIRFTGMNDSDIQQLQVRLENLLYKLRPNAVGIVDGFDIPDNVLNSALGAFDGRVYERIFEQAQKSPLNLMPVTELYRNSIQPLIKPKM